MQPHALTRVVRVCLVAVGDGLLVALERLGDRRDPREPLDAGHAVPAGDEQAHRGAVLRLERPAVHLVGEQHLGAQRLGEREAALVVVLDAALHAVVGAGEHELGVRRPNARPAASTSRSGAPVHSAVPTASTSHGWLMGRGESRARPLPAHSMRHGDGPRGRPSRSAQLQGQAAGPRSPPISRRQARWSTSGMSKCVEQVVQAGRRDVVAERLERHAAIARRELQLLGGERTICRLRAGHTETVTVPSEP